VSVTSFGLIVPHPPILVPAVGGGERLKAQATLDALKSAASALDRFAPDTLILMSPHAPAVYDTFLVDTAEVMSGSLAEFGDPRSYTWEVDTQLADAIISAVDMSDIPVAPRDADERLSSGWLDHASLVPLSLLDPDASYRVVVLSLSFLSLSSHRILGRLICETAQDLGRRVAFIASGDCSHRLVQSSQAGYSPRGREFDDTLVQLVSEGALGQLADIDPKLSEEAGECGLRSFVTLSGFSGDDPVPTQLLAYEAPWGVGYLTALVGSDAVAAAATMGSEVGDSEIVSLARRTLSARLLGTEPPTPVLSSSEYPERAGAFVSLHRRGNLRGCIGTIVATRPTLGEEVAHNVLEAALDDPRFDAMTADELDDLEISVDVLHSAEPASIDELDPVRYGVIVTAGFRRGLLLPDLEGVEDTATQLDIALRKAGISPDEDFAIERFRVDRFH
jgi:MEMO1 family protein